MKARLRPRRAKAQPLAPVDVGVTRKRKATTPPPSCEALPFAQFELQGRRDYMEDRVVGSTPLGSNSEYFFFGVYDGHGGSEASQFCQDNMAQAVAAASASLSATRIPAALRAAYSEVDEAFCKIANASDGKIESGSTAVSVIVGAKQFWVANTGDSRAVLVENDGRAATLTVDHSPGSKKEGARIRRAGGFVENDDGCFRVGGVLGVSRAIGDAYLKDYVISDPDVKRHNRKSKQSFIILGSDGLWDDVTPDDTAAVLGCGPNGNPPKTQAQLAACAKKLVKMAYKNGSEDNICCLIIDLRGFSPQGRHKVLEENDDPVDLTASSQTVSRARSITASPQKKR